MIDGQQRYHSGIICIFLFAAYAVIVCNLFFTQIYNHTFFVELAQQQYHVTLTQKPTREIIYDRTGVALAMNKECTSAFIIPIKVHDRPRTELFIKDHFPHAAAMLPSSSDRSFMFIKRRLTGDEIDLIKNSGISDIHLMKENHRFYPHEACACIVGITDIDNHGALGVEKMCNKQLSGKPTTYILQKDARSGYFYVKKKVKDKGHEGKSITLTIDALLQYRVNACLHTSAQELHATRGSVTIMDPDNGDLLTVASYPSFDANDSRNLVLEHSKNNAFVDCYEPGSIMKIFTALAALDEKVVTFEELIDCKNNTTALVDGRTVNTWKACGILPFYDVIVYSNNIGIASIAQRLKEKLYHHYIRLGFGTKTAIGFLGEASGFVNPPNSWSKQSAISLSYGYEIMGTPLQYARAFSLVCNGGYLVEPRLFMDTPVIKKGPLYSHKTLSMIQDILQRTTVYGTTKKAALKGYDVLAKTGSASTLLNGHYTDEVGNYTCAGIIRKGRYQRVIVVHLHIPETKKQYASTLVAPLFKKISETMVVHDKMF